TRPALLLADEPTGNLDSATGESVLALFDELRNDGLTLVVVTHDDKVSQHAERPVRLRDGRIEQAARPRRPSPTRPTRGRRWRRRAWRCAISCRRQWPGSSPGPDAPCSPCSAPSSASGRWWRLWVWPRPPATRSSAGSTNCPPPPWW